MLVTSNIFNIVIRAFLIRIELCGVSKLKRVSSLTGSSVYPSRFAIILKGNFIMANNVCGELGLRLQRQKGMVAGGGLMKGRGLSS